jgi:hypothetical protein
MAWLALLEWRQLLAVVVARKWQVVFLPWLWWESATE